MARTPDRFTGPREEEEIEFEDRGPGGDNAGDPTVDGAVRRVTDDLRFKTSTGVVSLIPANTLALLIVTTEGGVVYDTSGNIVVKSSD